MPHHYAARVARDALGRFRGNARTVFEDGLAGLIGVRQHARVHVDHDLVALARRAGIDAVVQRRLRHQRQRVGLLLRHRRHVVLLAKRFARGVQRAQEHCSSLRRQTSTHHDGAVGILIDVQRAARVLPRGLVALGLSIHMAPAAHDPLDVLRCTGTSHREQALLRLRRSNPRYRSHLRVRDLAARERCRQTRQRPERARHPHALACRAESSPTRQASHAAHDRNPVFQPSRASNSRIRSSRRAVAASRCADISAISSPRRSNSAWVSIAVSPFGGATLHPEFGDA